MAHGTVRVTGAWRSTPARTTRAPQEDLAFDNFEADGPGGAPTDGLYGADCGTSGGRFGVDFSGGDLPDGCAPWVVNDISKFSDDRVCRQDVDRAQAAYFPVHHRAGIERDVVRGAVHAGRLRRHVRGAGVRGDVPGVSSR